MADETGLRLAGVAVSTDDRPLLSAVDLELPAGRLIALQGPSGCGKTTLLRAICGLSDPAAGTILLGGRSAAELRWPIYRRRVVLMEQRPVLFEGSVEENLRRPFDYRTASFAFPRERAEELLLALGLRAEHLRQRARSLSEGEQQRVSLVRVLILQPEVVLLDEPTSALDEDAVDRVERLVRKEASERGLAGLIVTHDRNRAERWCHRVLDLGRFAAHPSTTGQEAT